MNCKKIFKVPVYLYNILLNKSDINFPLCASNAEYPARGQACPQYLSYDSHPLSSVPFEPDCQAGCALKDLLLLTVSVSQA